MIGATREISSVEPIGEAEHLWGPRGWLENCGAALERRRLETFDRYFWLPLQVPDTSLIEETRSVAPMSLPLIEPVLRDDWPAVEPVDDGLVDDGFVDDGLVDDGLVDDGYEDEDPAPLIECSSVPFTSTLWLRYFDQLELLLPLAIRLIVLGMLADDPVVPAVPVAELDDPVELCVASFSTN